jgi:hypothetical protein
MRTLRFRQYACDASLEVEPFAGKHDGHAIQNALDFALPRWGLKKEFCTNLLRDGASNAVRAATLLDVPHMSCVNHSLQLVVSALLLRPKRASKRTNQHTSYDQSVHRNAPTNTPLTTKACIETHQPTHLKSQRWHTHCHTRHLASSTHSIFRPRKTPCAIVRTQRPQLSSTRKRWRPFRMKHETKSRRF